MTERRDQPAREDLLRATTFHLRSEEDGDGFTLDGYGATFNSPTVIDSWEGRFKEVLVPGSWKKTLRERTPRLQFDHGMHPLIGSIPIGRITSITEETEGVHVIARLSDNWLIAPVRDAISEGAVDGMSFRFAVVRDEWKHADGKTAKPDEVLSSLWSSDNVSEDELLTRYLKEVKVSEVGPVVWPAYESTSVGVRSVTIDLGRLDKDPKQRRALADALFAADAIERGEAPPEISGPTETSDAPPPSGHPSSDPGPVAPDAPLTDEHPSPTPTPGQRQRQQELALIRARTDLALKGATRYVGN